MMLGIALGSGCAGACVVPGRPRDSGNVSHIPANRTALTHSVGRFDLRDPAGPRFAWPATAIEATFTGVGLDVRLRDRGTNFFAVVIDGGTPTSLATNRATERYELASGLDPGRHTVLLTKRTESNVGVVQFLGFIPHKGALVETPEPTTTRRIEFIGDSVTCGYGDLATDPSEHFNPATEDEASAYGTLTAAALGAQRSVIAYSGIGMYRDDRGSALEPMPVRFMRSLADDPTSAWGFRAMAPDVVVVNLGGNDFAKGDPGAAFQQAYVAFLKVLRTLYPDATIVCALSSMLTDNYPAGANSRTKAAEYIRGAVSQRQLAGDGRIFYFVFDEQRPADGFGADYHPSKATHRRMAAELVTALRSRIGW